MSKLRHNERVKLAAMGLNNLAVGSFVAEIIGFSITHLDMPIKNAWSLLGSGLFFSICMAVCAQFVLIFLWE